MRPILLLLILAMPVHADPLQDRIETAITAFGGLVPHAPDVGLSWADLVINNAVKQANPALTVSTADIGVWIMANQPAGLDAQTLQRAEWLASTFKAVMQPNTKYSAALPAQSISVAELKLRIDTAIDKVTPGPSEEELRLMEEASIQRSKEADQEYRNRRWPQ